jgi:hypothetical protein
MDSEERNTTMSQDINILTNLVIKQQQINQETAETLGKMSSQLEDVSQFIKNVYAGYKAGDEQLAVKVAAVDAKATETATKHRDAKKWLAGALAVITAEGSFLAFYFHYLSGKVELMLNAVKGHTP